mmetsp:Transcript_3108/g.7047  ORF Transcript_3108/g.7047 Transcript_3108/m.7047 type:complete len:373 (-) Transcript_3108:358-1476(-)
MSSAAGGVSLSGLQREQQDLNSRLYGPGREHSHGHGHGHDHGACEHEHSSGNVFIEEAEGVVDPGLEQCCIKELEDRRKWNELRKTLRRVDPVARAEREAQKVVVLNSEDHPKSIKSWLFAQREHGAHCGEMCEHVRENSDEDESEDAADDSDAELDEFLAEMEDEDFLQKFAQARIAECQAQQAKSITILSLENSLAAWLQGGGRADLPEPKVRFLLLESSKNENEPLMRNVRDALLRGVQGNNEFIAASVSPSLFSTRHPLCAAAASIVGTITLEEKDFPCVLALSGSKYEPLAALLRRQLERESNAVNALIQWLELTFTGHQKKIKGNESEDEEEPYCDKPGCSRRFPHEHVRRDMNRPVGEYVDCNEI